MDNMDDAFLSNLVDMSEEEFEELFRKIYTAYEEAFIRLANGDNEIFCDE